MTILDTIVRDTRALVARRRAEASVSTLEARASFRAPTLSLRDALRQPPDAGPAVLAEIKPASPSKGVIRPDLDVAEVARQYKRGGAAAVSVLTEPQHFGASLTNLALARHATDLPLLRKDFIVDPYQLVEARAYGADAVLLIATVLDRVQLAELHAAATDLGLDCLVEAYGERDLDRIDFDQVEILGVNNRDLATFEVDVERALRMFERAPSGIVKVAESGLRDAPTLARLRRQGIDAVLIGGTFMRAPRPGDALRQLREETDLLLQTPLRVAC